VNLTSDSTSAHGLGTFGWDDEGIPASSTPLVQNGVFVGYLMSRETGVDPRYAKQRLHARRWLESYSADPDGECVAQSGAWELEDMIADTDDGIFMETNRSWSIDDMRYNFQFGTEVGYEIKTASEDVF
jgi:TldD protein